MTLLLVIFLLISCNKKEKVIEYYQNGNPKTVYIYQNGIRQDSSIHYYENIKEAIKAIKYWKNDSAYSEKDFFENGKLMREGKLLRDNFRIGKWDLYSSENYKSEVIEYLNINGNSYANQNWKINNKGDTIVGGIYYELLKKDTANYGEPYRIHFFLKQRLLVNSEAFVYIPKKGYHCNDDFSNENQIKWKKIDNVAKWHKDFSHRKHDVILSFFPQELKNDTLRGYFVEREIHESNSDFDSITRKTYFNISYVIR